MMSNVRKHILSLSYDQVLLDLRRLVLEAANYKVTSVRDFLEALHHCKFGTFDLFIIGHSVPVVDRRVLIREWRRSCDRPVLALAIPGEPLPEGVDATIDPFQPRELLHTVSQLLKKDA